MSGNAIRIVLLADNLASEGLLAEHGFSAWIETAGRRLLFDTGQGPALEHNAPKLGIPLHTVDTLVLSHGHYDHTGGVPHVLEQAPQIPIYCHQGAMTDRYSIRDGVARSIGMPAATRAALEGLPAGLLHWVAQPIELATGVGVAAPVPRVSGFEDVGGPFFLDAGGHRPDPISDDLVLWLRTELGLVVVVGCCHAGLVNTLRLARDLTRESRIHAVLGGLHLREASPARLGRTLEALEELGVDLVVPCHCSGADAIARLQEVLGDRAQPGRAGAMFSFGAAITGP